MNKLGDCTIAQHINGVKMAKKKENSTDTITMYLVNEPILHDGEIYDKGDQIELTETQAEALLKVKAISEIPAETGKAE
jgi:hypothetical protein